MAYGGEERGLVGYMDADGVSQDHRRAISGYIFMVDGGAVSWSSKKQELVMLSTTEAKYVTATHAAKEAIWLCQLLTELFNLIDTHTTLFSHSKSAIALACDGHYHGYRRFYLDYLFYSYHSLVPLSLLFRRLRWAFGISFLFIWVLITHSYLFFINTVCYSEDWVIYFIVHY